MTIKITDKRKISDIQEEFNEFFQFLKIGFFSRPHGKEDGSEKKFMLNNNRTISKCRNIHKPGHITITPQHTVAEIEKSFRENYGLCVQIFRKSGKVWLQSTITDDWSLEEQNKLGGELSNFRAAIS